MDALFRRVPSTARIEYSLGYHGVPVSLSLPLSADAVDERVAFQFLENLLPENEATVARMAVKAGVLAEVFPLLAHYGQDVVGAVSLYPKKKAVAAKEAALPVVPVSMNAIAGHIAQLKKDPAAMPDIGNPRFSLAGQQGKFSLSYQGGRWYWPTEALPSTHIFKPGWDGHPLVERAELAAVTLADRVGVRASRGFVQNIQGQSVFVVERWDRVVTPQGGVVRVHAEDFLQAIGDPWLDKYGLDARTARNFAVRCDFEREHIRQVWYNVAVGNMDAHAKNYSILLSASGVRLAPLYDALPIFLWPEYDQTLCVSVNHKMHLEQVSGDDWVAFAETSGYDVPQFLVELRDIFSQVYEQMPHVFQEVGLPQEALQKALVWRETVWSSLVGLPEPSKIWVRPHIRNGKQVKGFWR